MLNTGSSTVNLIECNIVWTPTGLVNQQSMYVDA